MGLPARLHLGPLPDDFATELTSMAFNPPTPGDDLSAIEIPFTGEILGHVAIGGEAEVDAAFAAARSAQPDWNALGVAERAKIFERFHHLVLDNWELMADMVQIEAGKDRQSATEEVMDVAINSRFYSHKAGKLLKEQRVPGSMPFATRTVIQREPRGVVGQISPWNFPLALGISDAIPAMIAGNTVVAKPDSTTPFTSLLVAKLLQLAGLPQGVFTLVTGPGRVVGNAIAHQCDYLMFTGSTATGRGLGKIAGERLIGYSAELGGKNPLIVAADADMTRAVRESVNAVFANTGQLCVSVERIYVEAPIYDEFVERFAQATRNLTLGNTLDWNYQVGSLASASQLRTISAFVGDAVSKGAKVLAGGKARPELGPYFYEPTVLVDVTEEMDVCREETFGPVVYVQKVANLTEAVTLANDTEYGLNGAVMAKSATGRRIASQIMAGSVGINDGYMASWSSVSAPIGGMKASGMARRHGAEGILKYTESRTVAQQRVIPIKGPGFLPKGYFVRFLLAFLRRAHRYLP